ncbi:MAG: right-handed parallel beta-helix repeat-containing protein, partial [Candidatus Omnitrophica bacterium]|nr:right-handed parallel beta-helix repeat-containing protein [Candidatus Omnitrophota bacterium]
MTQDKKKSADHFFTRSIHFFFFSIKRLFTGLFSFVRDLFSAISSQNPYISGLQKAKAPVRKQSRFFPFASLRVRMTGLIKGSVPIIVPVILMVILILISFVLYLPKARGEGIFFNQTDWSGGAKEGAAAALSGWIRFEYADEGIDTTQPGGLTLSLIDGRFEDTTTDEFKEGAPDTTLAVADGTVTLSHPVRVNAYTVGAMPRISVTASTISGSDPWTIALSGAADLSRIFKSDKFTDAVGRVYKILSVSDARDTIIVIDSEGLVAAPTAGTGTVGRWYPSLSAWEDARDGDGVEDADITAGGRNAIERAVCYYDGKPDTSNLVIDGWATDEDHYIEITVPPSERHAGKWIKTAYTLRTAAANPNIYVKEDHTRIRGLQVENKSAGRNYALSLSGIGLEIEGNIIRGADNKTHKNWNFGILVSNESTAKIWNNIVYHFRSAGMKGRGIIGGGKEGEVFAYNNTVYGCDVGIDRGIGGVWVVHNNISYRNKSNYHGTFDVGSRSNLSGPTEGGAPGINAKNAAFVDFLDEDARDFHLNALDARAKNGGANLSADPNIAFTNDIDGDARPVSMTPGDKWDIGADEAGMSAVIAHSIGAADGRDFPTLQAWESARDGDLTKRHVFRTAGQTAAFIDGETVANAAGASGTYVKERDTPAASERFMTLDGVSGTFTTGDALTGKTSGAEATLEMALAVNGVIERGLVHNDAPFTGGVVIDGSVTDEHHYMYLTAAPRSRHTGRAGTGAAINMNKKKASAITIADDHARVEGLEVSNWGGAHAAVKVKSGAGGIVVAHMIIHDNDAAGAGSNDVPAAIDMTNDTGTMRAANNIIYNIANASGKKGDGIVVLTSTATRVEGNIVTNAAGAGIDTNHSMGVVVENNIAAGNGEDFAGKSSAASDYNISSDGSAPGVNALRNKTPADIAFVSTAAGAEDLRTMIGSAARAATDALALVGTADAMARLARYARSPHAGDDAWFPAFARDFHKAGAFTSRVFDTEVRPTYIAMEWTLDVPPGTSLTLRVRTGDNPGLSYGDEWNETPWDECPALTVKDGEDIGNVASVTNGERFIQYRAEFTSDDGAVTPALKDVTISFEGYPPDARELVSSAIDSGMTNNVIARLMWDETVHEGTDGIGVQLRSAPGDNGKPGEWSEWLGPTGVNDFYMELAEGDSINPSHRDSSADQWIQYRAELFTNGLSAPTLQDITIDFSAGPVSGTGVITPVPEPVAPGPVAPVPVTPGKPDKVKDLNKRFTMKFGADEAEIGDFNTDEFRPHAKLKRWGDEAYIEIDVPDGGLTRLDKDIKKVDGKIKWGRADRGSRFAKRERKDAQRLAVAKGRAFVHTFTNSEFGSLKIEVILDKKPKSNVVTFPIKTKNLKFYYQGPLTREETDRGVIRPAEVVDSYAVYHDNKRDTRYRSGKAFHIYRPKIIDAAGRTTWATPHIDARNGKFTVTIDQDWLDTAVYPVTVDPEFG